MHMFLKVNLRTWGQRWEWEINRCWLQSRRGTLVIAEVRKHPMQTFSGCSGPKARPSHPLPVHEWVSFTKCWLFCCCFWKTNASFQGSPSQLISVLRTLSPWTYYYGFIQVWDLDFVISFSSSWTLWTLLSYDTNFHRPGSCLADPIPCLSLPPHSPCRQDVAVCKCSLFSL